MSDSSEKAVFAKCRRGNDKLTSGQSCDGLKAVKLSSDGAHVVSLKCAKCGFTWNVPVGGATSI